MSIDPHLIGNRKLAIGNGSTRSLPLAVLTPSWAVTDGLYHGCAGGAGGYVLPGIVMVAGVSLGSLTLPPRGSLLLWANADEDTNRRASTKIALRIERSYIIGDCRLPIVDWRIT